MTRNWFGIAAIAAAGILAAGCSNPSSPTDPMGGLEPEEELEVLNEEDQKDDEEIVVNGSIHLSQDIAAPGDRITISATVDAVRAEDLRFHWINMTGRGTLIGETEGSVNGPFSIEWKAPTSLEDGSLNVEALHLVVTAISRVISVNEDGSHSSFDVSTWSEMIPIQISDD